MAGVAAAALAAAGLVGAGTAADAAITTQPAGVSITVDNTGANTALVSSAVVANVTVKNNSASSSLGVFTIVVPAGVSPVQAVGVQGPGNWRQSVLPCGTTANCSALVVVYASLPLSSSVVRPGQSVTSSIRFTTPAGPTMLAFKFLGIGNGLFTTTDAPSINVISGVAASWCVQNPGNVVAGTTKTFTVQAVSDGNECKFVSSKSIGVAATTMTVKFKTDDSAGGIVAGTSAGPLSGGSTITVALPPSSTGLYTFTGTFVTAALNQSIDAATPTAAGNSGGFDVSPDVPATVTVKSVLDKATGTTSLAKGAVFVTTYTVADRFSNPILTPSTAVSIDVSGGTFTRTGGANPFPGAPGANPGDLAIPATDGTVEGTFSGSGAQTLTASVGKVVSTTTVTVPSAPFAATFAAAASGSAVLVPNTPADIVTTGFTPGTAGPSCTVGTTCAGISLGFGGSGTASFAMNTCTDANIATSCGGTDTIVANLTASLKDANGKPLYDALNPAHMTYVCPQTRCDHVEGIAEALRDHSTYEESVEDFNAHPFLFVLSGSTTVQTAVDCATGSTHLSLPDEHLIDPGSVTTLPGTARSCVDVHNLVRTGNGDLIYEVYFYDDYKGFVG
jgi:hypothetical protein